MRQNLANLRPPCRRSQRQLGVREGSHSLTQPLAMQISQTRWTETNHSLPPSTQIPDTEPTAVCLKGKHIWEVYPCDNPTVTL